MKTINQSCVGELNQLGDDNGIILLTKVDSKTSLRAHDVFLEKRARIENVPKRGHYTLVYMEKMCSQQHHFLHERYTMTSFGVSVITLIILQMVSILFYE